MSNKIAQKLKPFTSWVEGVIDNTDRDAMGMILIVAFAGEVLGLSLKYSTDEYQFTQKNALSEEKIYLDKISCAPLLFAKPGDDLDGYTITTAVIDDKLTGVCGK